MPFDFKKEYKEFYMPKNKPEIVNIPKANYIAVRGKGDPNEEDGEYKSAIGILYAVAYTLKMSYKTDYRIEGFYDYVVPPLEGFWWQEGVDGIDYSDKSAFCWISVIRLPDFITKKDFDWAVKTAAKKKKLDCSKAEFLTIDEGLCVQIMHMGSFDNEPETVGLMNRYIAENGYENDFSDTRIHHEIYLSDARKVAPEKWKTVIRHPIKIISELISSFLIICLTLLTLSGCISNTAILNDTSHEATETEQTANTDEYTVKSYSVDWSDISADGLNEESFIQKLDIEVLEDVAGKLQSVVDEENEDEKKNPEIVVTEGFSRVLKKEKFLEVLNMGDKAQMPLYFILYKSENNGMYEYLCAYALCQLSGIDSVNESNGCLEWSNAKEFLEQFNEYIIGNQSR